jgi:hypothetical protein
MMDYLLMHWLIVNASHHAQITTTKTKKLPHVCSIVQKSNRSIMKMMAHTLVWIYVRGKAMPTTLHKDVCILLEVFLPVLAATSLIVCLKPVWSYAPMVHLPQHRQNIVRVHAQAYSLLMLLLELVLLPVR